MTTLSPFPNKIEIRDFKRFDKIAFQKALRNANGTPVYKSYDVNESLTRFFHTFDSISNSHAPLKSINSGAPPAREARVWTEPHS